MLGLRIDRTLEQRLEAIARQARRTKSEVAREAIARFVDAHDVTAEASPHYS